MASTTEQLSQMEKAYHKKGEANVYTATADEIKRLLNTLPAPAPNEGEEADNLDPKFEQIVSGEFKSWDEYTPLDFHDPVEMLYFFSKSVREGHIKPHGWQVEINKHLGKKGWTKETPLKLYLRAANGSGKDAYVLAIHAVFFAACKIRSRWICTSSSYKQISTQTEPYIRQYCSSINDFYGGEVFIIRKQHIVCTLTGSEILLYVSDDPDNIEGYHPFPDYPAAEMAIVINEAKSVQDEIFHALRRCTGFSVWIEVSSPGKALGHFFDKCISVASWDKRDEHNNVTMCVTAYDCPHIPISEIEEAELELPDWLFGSIYMARFSSVDEEVLIMPEILQKWIKDAVPKKTFGALSAGFDLAAGGDEIASYLIHGNYIKDSFFFREKDTTISAERLYLKCKQWSSLGLKQENCFGDDGGVGRGILDQIREKGWSINRVLNQSAAINKRYFSNRGAEIWHNGSRIISEGYFHLTDKDPLLIKQLGNRYYKQGETSGKMALESKKSARAKGRPSPDRADAWMLALVGKTVETFAEALRNSLKLNEGRRRIENSIKLKDREALEEYMDNLTLGEATHGAPAIKRKLAYFYSPRRNELTYRGR